MRSYEKNLYIFKNNFERYCINNGGNKSVVMNIDIAACVLTGVIFIINGIDAQKNNRKIQMCIFYVFAIILMGIYKFVVGYMLSIGLMIILFMI